MTAVFDLPNINGAYEVGIAVGVDPSLPDNHKLPILANANISRAAGYAAAWAASTFSSNPPEVRNLYSSAAAGVVLAGLAETVGGRPDGDWILRDQMDPTITEAAPPEAVTQDAIIKALSIVIATKPNLYMMNHHTGQGPLSGYARKVALVQHPAWRENDNAVVTAIHTVGHWASTIAIFNIAQVPGVKAVSGPTYTKTINVVLSHDARLRFAGMPAGTARHSIAYEGAKRGRRGAKEGHKFRDHGICRIIRKTEKGFFLGGDLAEPPSDEDDDDDNGDDDMPEDPPAGSSTEDPKPRKAPKRKTTGKGPVTRTKKAAKQP
ncbi:unnamed protein product [Bemisia tabaci]|uniref:Uncharacterized protein n=1 Tax=Bemisia tabaci TaxID=7038 RepID=A0A9P0EXC2_BEMTA|nr:unnamed protein product [Bemisia tabaci]